MDTQRRRRELDMGMWGNQGERQAEVVCHPQDDYQSQSASLTALRPPHCPTLNRTSAAAYAHLWCSEILATLSIKIFMSLQHCGLQPVSCFNNMKHSVEGAQRAWVTIPRTQACFQMTVVSPQTVFASPSRVQTRISKKDSKCALALASKLALWLVLQLLLQDI